MGMTGSPIAGGGRAYSQVCPAENEANGEDAAQVQTPGPAVGAMFATCAVTSSQAGEPAAIWRTGWVTAAGGTGCTR
eukprot:1173869-Prorocentrum_minimum.AAC.1